MSADQWGLTAILLYGILAAVLIVWRAVRSPLGWQVWMLYVIARSYGRLGFHWRANRPCPFPLPGPAMIICNHRSPVDPLFIWMGIPHGHPPGFLTAQEYCEQPGLRFINQHLKSIPVARNGKDMSAMRAAIRRLQEGKLLGVFPEGRINTGPGLLPADPGVAWLALKSRVPVYPVFIHNAPTGRTMVEPFFNFRRVRLTYGDPVDLSRFYDRDLSREVLQEATDTMMSRLAELGLRSEA